MVELSDDKSYIAELQRRDARAALDVAQVRILPFGDWNINDYE